MSHTYEGKDGTLFHYNSDMSGDVQISHRRGDYDPIYVSGRDLLAFVASYVRARRIAALEDAPDHELLGITERDVPNE